MTARQAIERLRALASSWNSYVARPFADELEAELDEIEAHLRTEERE